MKKKRHDKIREIIAEHTIETQEELLEYLRRAGYDVTQATVSRDIKELRLMKALDENEVYRYMSPRAEKESSGMNFHEIFVQAVISIERAMQILVVKCHVGMAQAVCAVLDNMEWHSIVGTLAGDDTILVVARDEQQAMKLEKDMNRILYNK